MAVHIGSFNPLSLSFVAFCGAVEAPPAAAAVAARAPATKGGLRVRGDRRIPSQAPYNWQEGGSCPSANRWRREIK